MKTWSTAGMLLAAAVLMFVLIGCEGDQGPAGPPGTASCLNCHTDQFDAELATFLKPIQQEFSFSQHFLGDTYERNTNPCSRCHTNEGFQHYVNTGEVEAVPTATRIHCWTCHAPHTNETFEVRVTAPVTFDVGGVYDKGPSNTCVTCHQAREASPAIADNVTLASNQRRWGPHHSTQGNILAGLGAYEFNGPYSTNAAHNGIANGCVGCHMAEPMSPELGGHSFWVANEDGKDVNINGCDCHTTWTVPDTAYARVEETKEEFLDKLQSLGEDMKTLGWMDPNAGNGYVNPGTYSADQLGAMWNWQMLKEDLSGSVHNVVFANAVLEATQAFVTGEMAARSLAQQSTKAQH